MRRVNGFPGLVGEEQDAEHVVRQHCEAEQGEKGEDVLRLGVGGRLGVDAVDDEGGETQGGDDVGPEDKGACGVRWVFHVDSRSISQCLKHAGFAAFIQCSNG